MPESTPPPVSPAPVAPAAPAKSGNRTLIIVLCVIGGLLLLMGGCAVACTLIVGKKAKEFAEVSEKNPAYAGLTMIAAFSPDVEIVSKDLATGIVKLRNKKTNEIVTVDTTKYTADNIGEVFEKIAAGKGVPVKLTGADAQTVPAAEAAAAGDPESISPQRGAALDANLKKFPASLPAYPGATTLQAKISTAMGVHTYEYSAQTKDKPEAIADFYAKKFTAAGFTLLNRSTEANDHGASANLTASATEPAGTVTLQATTQENGQVEVELTGVFMAKE